MELLHDHLVNVEFEIGEKVWIQLPESPPGIVVAYVMYDTHLEYLVRTSNQGVQQLEGITLTSTPAII